MFRRESARLFLAWARARFGPHILAIKALTNGRLSDRRICLLPRQGWRNEWLSTRNGRIATTIWAPARIEGKEQQPAIILIHGSHGPLPLYQFLALLLARNGITTLLLDLPGFGRSDIPGLPWRPDQFTGKEEIIAGLAYLRNQPLVDPRRISLFGHSLGGGVVIHAAEHIPDLFSVIALGPTRQVEKRFAGEAAKEALFFRARFAVAHGLRPWPDQNFVRTFCRKIGLEFHLRFWQQRNHPPLLLLDGEFESASDKAFLGGLFDQIRPPVQYCTIPRADHYLNTIGLGRLVLYDQRAVEICLEWVVDWILSEPKSPKYS